MNFSVFSLYITKNDGGILITEVTLVKATLVSRTKFEVKLVENMIWSIKRITNNIYKYIFFLHNKQVIKKNL